MRERGGVQTKLFDEKVLVAGESNRADKRKNERLKILSFLGSEPLRFRRLSESQRCFAQQSETARRGRELVLASAGARLVTTSVHLIT